MTESRIVERILEKHGVSPDAYPRCVFDGKVCTGDSFIQLARLEQAEDIGGLYGTPRGAHIEGTRYYVCDSEADCDGRFMGASR